MAAIQTARPFNDPRSFTNAPDKSIFTKPDVRKFKERAAELNNQRDGDLATFFYARFDEMPLGRYFFCAILREISSMRRGRRSARTLSTMFAISVASSPAECESSS